MELPVITLDDLMENINDMEQTNIWMLKQFEENEELRKDETDLKKVYKSAVCQSVVARIIERIASNENSKKLLDSAIEYTTNAYKEAFENKF